MTDVRSPPHLHTNLTFAATFQFMEDSMLDTDNYFYELFDDTEIEGYVLDTLVGMVKYKFGDYEVHPRDEVSY